MAQPNLPDSSAIDKLLDSLTTKYCIDPDRLEFPEAHSAGHGGFGEVSRAILHPAAESPRSLGIAPCGDAPGHRSVAVKKLTNINGIDTKRLKRMFAREVHVWSSAKHPNILAFIGFHLELGERAAWLISDWEPFGNIKEYLESTEVSLVQKLKLLHDTAQALVYLHSHSPPILHGDIKSANVLVTRDVRAVMCDFGLARIIEDEEFQAIETPATTLKCSIRWCSPELFANERTSPQSDMWAWGWLVWEVVTGKLPFPKERTDVAICGAICTGRLPGPTDEPIFAQVPRLWKLAIKCWHNNPASRPSAEYGSQKLLNIVQSALVEGSTVLKKQPVAREWLSLFIGKISSSLVSDEFESPAIADKSLARTQSRRPQAAPPAPYVKRAPEAPIEIRSVVAPPSRETFDPNASPSGTRTSGQQFVPQRSPSPHPAPTVQSGSHSQEGFQRREPPQPLAVPSSGGGLANTLLTHIIPSPDVEPPTRPSTKTPISPPYDQVSDLSGKLIKLRDKPTKAGGFADVWEGTLLTTGEKVAIKSLRAVDVDYASPQSNEVTIRLDKRLKREMLVWKPLDHKRITKCLGFARVDGMPSLVSPWCENGNAHEYVIKHPDCNKGAMIVQVAEGLVYLHTRERVVVHYDVKSPNILINDNGEAMLNDYGVSKVIEEAKTGFTTPNATALCIDCSSPEAVKGEQRNTGSDVYSFACFILEIFTGKLPFYEMNRNTVKIATAKFKGQKPDPKLYPELPESDPLWPLLNRCWNQEPEDRPTMPEVLAELHQLGYQA